MSCSVAIDGVCQRIAGMSCVCWLFVQCRCRKKVTSSRPTIRALQGYTMACNLEKMKQQRARMTLYFQRSAIDPWGMMLCMKTAPLPICISTTKCAKCPSAGQGTMRTPATHARAFANHQYNAQDSTKGKNYLHSISNAVQFIHFLAWGQGDGC